MFLAACFLQQIIEVNDLLRQALDRGMPINSLMETWDFLQVGFVGQFVSAFCGFDTSISR